MRMPLQSVLGNLPITLKFDPFYPEFNADFFRCDSFSPKQTITAEPYNFTLRRDEVAILVIDMQREILIDGGFGTALGYDISLMNSMTPTVVTLIEKARANGIPVIFTRLAY